MGGGVGPRPWATTFRPGYGRICAWPRARITTARAWELLGLAVRNINRVRKVERVVQRENIVRMDIFVDRERCESVREEIREARVTRDWGVKEHLSYKVRKAQGMIPARACVAVTNEEGLIQAKVASWNVRSIREKRDEIFQYLVDENVEILALQETWRGVKEWPLRLDGYQVFEVVAAKQKQGELGLALAVKNTLVAFESGKPSQFCLSAKVMLGGTEWNIVNIYIPPKAPVTKSQALIDIRETITKAINHDLDAKVMILGDWNMTPVKLGRLLRRWGLTLVVVECTGSSITKFRGNSPWSAIDHMVVTTSALNWVKNSRVNRGYDLSDHWPLESSIGSCRIPVGDKAEVKRAVEISIPALQQRGAAVRDDNRWKVLEEEMEGVEDGEVLDLFLEAVKEVVTSHGIGKQPSRNQKKTTYKLTKAAKRAIRERRVAFKRWLETEAPTLGGPAHERYLWSKSKATKEKRKSSKISWAKHLEVGPRFVREGDSKKLWNWVQGLIGTGMGEAGGDGPLFKQGNSGELAYSPEEKLVAWHRHYSRLLRDETGHSRNQEHWGQVFGENGTQPIPELDSDISWDELSDALCRMKNGAAGFDGVPPQFFKLAKEAPREETVELEDGRVIRRPVTLPSRSFGKVVLNLCQRIFRSGVPDRWNVAWVVSIPKKGDPKCMDNYRGISLISIIVKLVTSIVTERVQTTLEAKRWFIREQAGFRRGEEAVAQACALYEVLSRQISEDKQTFMAFIDIKKAYDSVPIEAILRKLEGAGVGGRTLAYFRGLYENAKVRIRTAYGVSDEIKLERGLRQGCNASPLLFDIFINDILDGSHRFGVEVCGVQSGARMIGNLFADDLALTCGSMSDLQWALDHIGRWSETNEMAFGLGKCGIMGVGEGAMDSVRGKAGGFLLNGGVVPIVDSYTYLGLVFDPNISLEVMVQARADVARKTLQSIRPALGCHDIPLGIKADTMIKTLLLPKLTYGGELWGMQQRRVVPAQRVLDEGLRTLARLRPGSAATSGVALGYDLGVPTVLAMANRSKTRALVKFPHLSTVISTLIQEVPKQRKRTWVTGGSTHLKTYFGEALVRNERTGEESWSARRVKEITWANQVAKGGASTDKMVEWHLNESSGYLARGDQYSGLARGFHWLHRVRTSSVWMATRLARAGILSARYIDECPFCHQSDGAGESIGHLIEHCAAWAIQRENILTGFFEGACWVNLIGGWVEGAGWTSGQVLDLWVGALTPRARDLTAINITEEGVDGAALPGCVRIAAFLQLVLPVRQAKLQRGLEPMRADAVIDGRAALADESDSEVGNRGEDTEGD